MKICILMLSLLSFSQTLSAVEWSVGIKGGPGYEYSAFYDKSYNPWQTSSEPRLNDSWHYSRYQYSLGAFSEFQGKFVGTRLELLYSQYHWDASGPMESFGVDSNGNVNQTGTMQVDLKFDRSYLEIPVLFKVTAPLPVRPILFLGPAFAYRMSNTNTTVIDGQTYKREHDSGKKTRVSLIAGLGADIPIDRHRISMDFRYQVFSAEDSFSEGTDYGSQTEQTLKPGRLSFMLGYGFDLLGGKRLSKKHANIDPLLPPSID
jgi:hypothetical protein